MAEIYIELKTFNRRKKEIEGRISQYSKVAHILRGTNLLEDLELVKKACSVLKENGNNPAYKTIESNMKNKMFELMQKHRKCVKDKEENEKCYKEGAKITDDYAECVLKELLLDSEFRTKVRVLDKAGELTADAGEKEKLQRIIDSKCKEFEELALKKRELLEKAKRLAETEPEYKEHTGIIEKTPVSELSPILRQISKDGFSKKTFH